MKNYDARTIEKKWQKYWEENHIYKSEANLSGKENYYVLSEFAYPSGNLHVGHWYAFAVPDIYARYKRMQGYNVLYPIGFDAFGLPAENAAIKRNLDPKDWTYKNMAHMEQQLKSMGASFDWERKIATSDPEYYKWTQWMFTKFYENGIVKQITTKTNWCDSCKTVLANEQVLGGKCERCDTEVVQKDMKQWAFKITDFADDLIDDLENLDWDESIKQAQREWIGRKEGSEIDFTLNGCDKKIKVFTTRADTLFGVTYLVLAPEHQLLKELKDDIENWDEVEAYIKETEKKSELDRQQNREKTGVELKGISIINPANNEEIPVWVADYVLAHFGTGAVMAVPAHDERDADFAIRYDLPFRFVVLPSAGESGKEPELLLHGEIDFIRKASEGKTGQEKIQAEWNAFYDFLNEVHEVGGMLPSGKRICSTCKGRLINSGQFSRMKSDDAISQITNFVGGEMKKTYRLRDWGISRQRYWGTPIPIVYNEKEREEIYKNAHVINFYNQEAWFRLRNGYKTIETRALNPEEKDRYFGDFEVGEYLRAINKETKEDIYLKIKKIWKFDNLEKLLDSPEIIKKIYAPKKPAQTMKELICGYSFTNNYVNKINKNGLIAWEIELINPGIRVVPEEHLPWLLPEDVDHTPDGTAPLARSQELQERTERIFGKGWTPEVDTMDTFVDSSWYFYRYLDAKNQERFASQENIENWMPVSMYFGGAAHTTMHLLYSRFWVKALHKLDLVPHKEPYIGRLNRGLILGPDGAKMSKSKGNVIDPDEVVAHVGADVVRMYLAFIGPFNEPGNYSWDTNGVVGMRRFIERIYALSDKLEEVSSENLVRALHKTIKKATEDIERLKLNTAISAMMVWVKLAEKEELGREEYRKFLKLFAVFAPHMADEIWQENLGEERSIHLSDWPVYEEKFLQEDNITLPIQINGKVRAQLEISVDVGEEEVRAQALALPEIQKWIEGKEIKKVIYIKGRIVNIVV